MVIITIPSITERSLDLASDIIDKIFSWCCRNKRETSAPATKMSQEEHDQLERKIAEAEKRIESALQEIHVIRLETLLLVQRTEKEIRAEKERAEEQFERARRILKETRNSISRKNSGTSAQSQTATVKATSRNEWKMRWNDPLEPVAGPSDVTRTPKRKKNKISKEPIKKREKRGETTERVDRKALFSIKDSSLYRERGVDGKFKPKAHSKPVATSTPVVKLKCNGNPDKTPETDGRDGTTPATQPEIIEISSSEE